MKNVGPLSDLGKLMARYCIAFDTVKIISEGKGNETVEQLVRMFVHVWVLFVNIINQSLTLCCIKINANVFLIWTYISIFGK